MNTTFRIRNIRRYPDGVIHAALVHSVTGEVAISATLDYILDQIKARGYHCPDVVPDMKEPKR